MKYKPGVNLTNSKSRSFGADTFDGIQKGRRCIPTLFGNNGRDKALGTVGSAFVTPYTGYDDFAKTAPQSVFLTMQGHYKQVFS